MRLLGLSGGATTQMGAEADANQDEEVEKVQNQIYRYDPLSIGKFEEVEEAGQAKVSKSTLIVHW